MSKAKPPEVVCWCCQSPWPNCGCDTDGAPGVPCNRHPSWWKRLGARLLVRLGW